MKHFDHPNIIRIINYYLSTNNIYIVTELCTGGEVLEKILEFEFFNENAACGIIRMIVSAIKYSHSFGVLHRKLKPEHVLFESDKLCSNLKIIDFEPSL